MTESDYPMVSVLMITYNHDLYIAQAIEGVLMQKVDFEMELVIGEDCSTDSTRAICSDYASKYPGRIRLLTSDRNHGMMPNFLRTLDSCSGKYIAMCEGDDYWIDPLKLQKQVHFLEANTDFGLVHTSARIFNQKNHKYLRRVAGDPNNSYEDVLIKNRIITATVCLRNKLLKKCSIELMEELRNWKMGDYPIWLWFSLNSKIKFLPEITTIYRILNVSASRPKDTDDKILYTNSLLGIKKFFVEKYGCKEEVWLRIQKDFAVIKIKKSVLINSYTLYKEGIDIKKAIGINVTIIDKIYGLMLSNKYLAYALKYALLLRRNSI